MITALFWTFFVLRAHSNLHDVKLVGDIYFARILMVHTGIFHSDLFLNIAAHNTDRGVREPE